MRSPRTFAVTAAFPGLLWNFPEKLLAIGGYGECHPVYSDKSSLGYLVLFGNCL
jgi:hypothetical protein